MDIKKDTSAEARLKDIYLSGNRLIIPEINEFLPEGFKVVELITGMSIVSKLMLNDDELAMFKLYTSPNMSSASFSVNLKEEHRVKTLEILKDANEKYKQNENEKQELAIQELSESFIRATT